MSEPVVEHATAAGADSSARDRILVAIVLALSAFLFMFRLGARALWSSEGRWAEIAREMILSSNYFWPTINGRLYYDKPLPTYWLVVAATRVTGAMNEAAARLPCAAAALIGVALLIALVTRLYDPRRGAMAGFILATSFSFVFFSRHASADIETVTGVLAAVLLFSCNSERRGGVWVIALWLLMAATSLTKGLLGFALPILIIGSYSMLAEGWGELFASLRGGAAGLWGLVFDRNRWFFNWSTIPAAAIALPLYYLPFAISNARMHSDTGAYMVFRENVQRFFAPFDHKGPFYLYVYVIVPLMAPWSVFLPAALVRAHERLRNSQTLHSDRFALVYFWATFIFFTASGSRRSYYLLPILPAAAALVALLLCESPRALSRLVRSLTDIAYGLLVVAIVAAGVLLLPTTMRPGSLRLFPAAPVSGVLAVIWVVALAGVAWALQGLRRDGAAGSEWRIALSSGLIAYLSLAYIFLAALPAVDVYRGEKPFARAVRDSVNGDFKSTAIYNDTAPYFYLESPDPIASFDRPAALRDAVGRGGVRWLILRARDLPAVELPGVVVIREATFPWENPTQLKNKQVLYRLD